MQDINQWCEYLNVLLAIDRECISLIARQRMPANQKLINHMPVNHQGLIGMIGVINGFFDGTRTIAASYDYDDHSFLNVNRFVVINKEESDNETC